MDFKEIIKDHLDKMAEQDEAFAVRYKMEDKSIDDCVKYIFSQAQKQKTGNCAAIEDAVVYGWAVHYYQEDNKTLGMDKKSNKPATTKVEVKKTDIKPIKAIVSDKAKAKKQSNNCVELDLFGGF